MKLLVIGSGGREHTIVWKLLQSPIVKSIAWTPGNPATQLGNKVKIENIKVDDVKALANYAEAEKIDLTVVGPEVPLVAGVADEFIKRNLKIFGPIKQAAQLEGSKVFSKEFFLRHNIPTGKAEIFSNFDQALKYAKSQPKPIVIKADGLAAGKGVLICKNDEEIESGLRDIMLNKVFGEAGGKVLVEECLTGQEVSVHAITDGNSYQILASAQDHKRALDGDQGLNTGGMGTYSPTPLYTPELEARVKTEIFDRTLAGLKKDKIPFCGVLYAGLMLTKDGPKILEYNCRFGDPETQVILSRLESDLAEVLLATCSGKLSTVTLKWSEKASVCVIMAAGGYPGDYRKGDAITGIKEAEEGGDVMVFHAGTTLKDGKILTSGGRVLGVTALGSSLGDAVSTAYKAVEKINIKGVHYRRDIAGKVLKHNNPASKATL